MGGPGPKRQNSNVIRTPDRHRQLGQMDRRDVAEGRRRTPCDVDTTGGGHVREAYTVENDHGVRWQDGPANLNRPVHHNPNAVNQWGGPTNVRPGDCNRNIHDNLPHQRRITAHDSEGCNNYKSSSHARFPYERTENEGRYDKSCAPQGRTYQETCNQRGGSYKVPSGKRGGTYENPTEQRECVMKKSGPIYKSTNQSGQRGQYGCAKGQVPTNCDRGSRGNTEDSGCAGRSRRPTVQYSQHDYTCTGPVTQRGEAYSGRGVSRISDGCALGKQGSSCPLKPNSLGRPSVFNETVDQVVCINGQPGRLLPVQFQGIPGGRDARRSGTVKEDANCLPPAHGGMVYRTPGPGTGVAGGPGSYGVGLYSDPSGFATFGGLTYPFGIPLVGGGGNGVWPIPYGGGIMAPNVGPYLGPIVYGGPTGVQMGNPNVPASYYNGQMIGMAMPPWQLGPIGLVPPAQVGGIGGQSGCPYNNSINQNRVSQGERGNQFHAAGPYRISVDQGRFPGNVPSRQGLIYRDGQGPGEIDANRGLNCCVRPKQGETEFEADVNPYNRGNASCHRFSSAKSGTNCNVDNATRATRSGRISEGCDPCRLPTFRGGEERRFAGPRRGVPVSRGVSSGNRGGCYTGFRNVQESQDNCPRYNDQDCRVAAIDTTKYDQNCGMDRNTRSKGCVIQCNTPSNWLPNDNIGRPFDNCNLRSNREERKREKVCSIKIGGGPILDDETLQNYSDIIHQQGKCVRRTKRSRGDFELINRGVVNRFNRDSYFNRGSIRGKGRGIARCSEDETGRYSHCGNNRTSGPTARYPIHPNSRRTNRRNFRGPGARRGRSSACYSDRNSEFKDETDECD